MVDFVGYPTRLIESYQHFYSFSNAQVELRLALDKLMEDSGICTDHGEVYLVLMEG